MSEQGSEGGVMEGVEGAGTDQMLFFLVSCQNSALSPEGPSKPHPRSLRLIRSQIFFLDFLYVKTVFFCRIHWVAMLRRIWSQMFIPVQGKVVRTEIVEFILRRTWAIFMLVRNLRA